MTGSSTHTFYIRLSNAGVALNPDLILPLSSTNLPYTSMRFRDQVELYWEVSIQKYEKEQYRLFIDIQDYEPEDVTSFFTQKPKSPVDYLEFSKIVWIELYPHLSFYKKSKFDHLLEAESDHQEILPQIVQRSDEWYHKKENREVQLTFSVPFERAKFVTGGVLVKHRVDTYEVEFLIENGFILREFELLKEYFAKALDKQKFFVSAKVHIENGQITNASATSTDIAQIDERILGAVKFLEAKSIHHTSPSEVDKELFTADDLYERDLVEESTKNGIELLEILIRDEHIRNRKQIQYLAGKLHLRQHKILFTAHPQFGFVFQLQGQAYMHFVWELLNSHATYIWSYDPQTTPHNLALRKLEFALSVIRTQGRQSYRFGMSDDVGISDLHFHVIRHDKASSSISDGFPLWRAQLHERLV